MEGEIFGPIGECIYCGKSNTRLTKEHIIPYGLSGKDVILKASCKNCQNITSKFEMIILRKEILQVRTKLNMPSRKSSLPDKLPLTAKIDGSSKTVYLSTAEQPVFVTFLEYPLPGLLGGEVPEKGINIIGVQNWQLGKPNINEVLDSLRSKEFEIEHVFYGNAFERLLAKIAFGYAVAKYGIDKIKQSPLRDIILGKSEFTGRYIGMLNAHPPTNEKFHRVKLIETGSWLFAVIRLFTGMPEYIVIVLIGDEKTKPKISFQPVALPINPGSNSSQLNIIVKQI